MKVTGSVVNTQLDPKWGKISGDITDQKDLMNLVSRKDEQHLGAVREESRVRAQMDAELTNKMVETTEFVNRKADEFTSKINDIDVKTSNAIREEAISRESADSNNLLAIRKEEAARIDQDRAMKLDIDGLKNQVKYLDDLLMSETSDRRIEDDNLNQYINQQVSNFSSQIDLVNSDVTSINNKIDTMNSSILNLSDNAISKDKLIAGENIEIKQVGENIKISSTGEVSIDYEDIINKPTFDGKVIEGELTKESLNLQDKLISGENIKTINGKSLLGTGNINIQSEAGGFTSISVNDQTPNENGNIQLTAADIPYAALKGDLDTKQNVFTVGDRLSLNDAILKVDVSDLEADINKLNASIEASATDLDFVKSEVEKIPGLQEKLIVGNNIKIENNEISAVDTVYKAGHGIIINEDTNEISTEAASLTAGKNITLTEKNGELEIAAPGAVTGVIFKVDENDTNTTAAPIGEDGKTIIVASKLQKKLIPGSGITITNDGTISAASATKYIAGDGVNFTTNQTTGDVTISAAGSANAVTTVQVDDIPLTKTQGAVNIKLNDRFNLKQNRLTAGDNINIDTNNRISATVPIKQINYNGVKVEPNNSVVNIKADDKQDKLINGVATKINSNQVNVQYDDTLELVDGKLSTKLKDIQQDGKSIVEDGVVNLPSSITSNGGKFNQGSSIFTEYNDASGIHSETIFNLDEFTTLNVGTAAHMTNIIGAPVVLKTMSDKRPILNTSDNYILSRNDLDSDTVYWDADSQKIKSKASGGVTSSNNSVSDIIKCTQAQYDALITPDPKTLYIIVG